MAIIMPAAEVVAQLLMEQQVTLGVQVEVVQLVQELQIPEVAEQVDSQAVVEWLLFALPLQQQQPLAHPQSLLTAPTTYTNLPLQVLLRFKERT
jgi:hypothetical protein